MPKTGGTLTFGTMSDVTSFDPIAAGGVGTISIPKHFPIFDALAIVDTTSSSVQLRLLESATSTDSVTWTFKVKPDVKFSDGTAFDAPAIQYNWERFADPDNKYFGLAPAQSIRSMTVTDPLTLTVVLENATDFPRVIAESLPFIGSPTALEADAAGFATNPVGAGAYTLKEWVPNSQATLVRNASSSVKAYIDTIIVKTIPDETERLDAFKSGTLDVNLSADKVTMAQENLPGVKFSDDVTQGGFNLMFNMEKLDLKTRQALAYAMDPVALNKAVFPGAEQPAVSLFNNASPFHNKKFDQVADDKKAQALFDEIAAANGEKPLAISLMTSPTFLAATQWYETKLAGFENVSVTIENVTEASTFVTRAATGDFQAAFFSSSPLGAASYRLYFQTKGQMNFTRFSDPAVDAGFAKLAAGAISLEEQVSIFNTLQEKVQALVPAVIYTACTHWYAYHSKKVHGLSAEAGPGLAMFTELWVS